MAIVKFTNSSKGLGAILSYITQESKTTTRLISGQNCVPENALLEMTTIKNLYGKNSGRQYIHIVQSFAPTDNVSNELAHEIGRQLAAHYSGFQAVIATHVDRGHCHNHIVLNSVNMETGLKFQQSQNDLWAIKDLSNELCEQYGLSTIAPRRTGVSMDYSEWKDDRQGHPTWRSLLRAEIDQVIKRCHSESQFVPEMQRRGYEVSQGKNLGFRAPGQQRFIRIASLGEGYTYGDIMRRIYSQKEREAPKPREYNLREYARVYRYHGVFNPQTHRKVPLTHFEKLYWRYMYLLGKAQKRQLPQKQIVYLRPEIVKFKQYLQENNFVHAHTITSMSDLDDCRTMTLARVSALVDERTELHQEKRTSPDPNLQLDHIAQLNAQLRQLRRDLRLMNRIEKSISNMRVQIATVKEMEAQAKGARDKQEQQTRQGLDYGAR